MCERGRRRGTTAIAQSDARRFAPATARNRLPILDVLRPLLPANGLVLEIASGSGEHVIAFARALPDLEWQPSDPSAEARASIAAWLAAEGLPNLRAAIDLDVQKARWPIEAAAAILCINMIHITPWSATEGLMRGAGALLPPGGLLYLYGPFLQQGVPTAPSNVAFNADLRMRDPDWGLRELDDVVECAASHGLRLEQVVAMPANNLSAVFRRGDA